MTDLVLPKSSITVAIAELRPHFPGIQISSRAPQVWPKRWIRVSRIGGDKDWAIDRALMLFECWAQTANGGRDDIQAESDALLAYTVLEHPKFAQYWDGGSIVPYDDPDKTGWARVQVTGTLGVAIT
ncbi:hypothetical protein [Gordonia malaquae]|uniref:hypothetical protein n=1 Tax=Gordonia malaquae TaxID=410332 RepID=UPI0030196CFD